MQVKKILVVWLILFSIKIFPQTWEEQISGVTVDLEEVCFVDSLYGWAIGDSATILHTSDGGRMWIKQLAPADTLIFTKIQFINRIVGFIVGHGGLFLSTTDGGMNWIRKETGTNYAFWDLSFISEKKGWLVGSLGWFYSPDSIILNTTNGGETWESKHISSLEPPYILHAIKFISDSVGVTCGSTHMDVSATFFLTSINGGVEWDLRGNSQTTQIYLALLSKDTILAGYVALAITTNGGVSWSYYNDFFNTYISDLKTFGSNTIWFKGYDFVNQHKIYKSTDSGNSWISFSVPTSITINSISPINKNEIIAVGLNGRIIKFSEIKTSVRNDENKALFSLSQNYPNPFNSVSKITFYLPERTNVVINVYDILGRTIKSIFAGYKTIGYHTVEFNGDDLASGTYFYEIITERYRLVKKALLLK
ncbi:MAG: YCF48-related protein [Melioribacteraceae bacterium]|nr:YCF48-related protein [Melioribacteraceae bacterium]